MQLETVVEKTKLALMSAPADKLFDVAELFPLLPKSMVVDGQIRHRFGAVKVRLPRSGESGFLFEVVMRDVLRRICVRLLSTDPGPGLVSSGVSMLRERPDRGFHWHPETAEPECARDENDVTFRFR